MSEKVKVYRVNRETNYAGRPSVVRLQSAEGRATLKTVVFDTWESAFGHHKVIAREDAALTPDEAINDFVNWRLSEIEGLQKKIRKLNAEIDAARVLTTAEPVSVIKEEG
jgi:hypothetical protein